MTMTLISTTTVGAAGASTIDFTSIPQTFTDLLVVTSLRSSAYADFFYTFNGVSTGSTRRWLQGNGSSAASNTGTDYMYLGLRPDNTYTANTFNNAQIYVPNYSLSGNTKVSSVDSVGENNASETYLMIVANGSTQTAAVTRLTVGLATGNFVQYSTVSLYGILKGSGGATVS